MSMRILDPTTSRRVPWANGLGTTLEVATDALEPGAPWTWRLSIADIPERSPFSVLAGIDRSIGCIEGEGMTLLLGADAREVPRTGNALGFAGEECAIGQPRGPGVRDVNLMVRRERWRGRMTILRASALDMRAPLLIVHVAAASAPVRVLGARRSSDCVLVAGSTLLAQGHAAIPAAPGSVLVACVLTPRAAAAELRMGYPAGS